MDRLGRDRRQHGLHLVQREGSSEAAPHATLRHAGDVERAARIGRLGGLLGFVSLSQRTVLKQGAVRVRVTSRRAGRVRVFVASRRGKVSVVSTRTKTVKLRARHRRTVRLKLTRAGRRELSGCVVKRKLVATAVPGNHTGEGVIQVLDVSR